MDRFSTAMGALLMFLGIAAGAFGAHGLKDYFLEYPVFKEIFEKAVFYQLLHALTLFVLPQVAEKFRNGLWRLCVFLFIAGILLFSGSLFLLSLTQIRGFGAITPIGGIALLAGWGLLFISSLKRSLGGKMPHEIKNISPKEVAQKRAKKECFVLLDVREDRELAIVNLGDSVVRAPMSQLHEKGVAALPNALADKSVEVVVFCHHGGRSAEVTAWLMSQGWTNVKNMVGGIDAYALAVDPSLRRY